jgi:hypothetical protein
VVSRDFVSRRQRQTSRKCPRRPTRIIQRLEIRPDCGVPATSAPVSTNSQDIGHRWKSCGEGGEGEYAIAPRLTLENEQKRSGSVLSKHGCIKKTYARKLNAPKTPAIMHLNCHAHRSLFCHSFVPQLQLVSFCPSVSSVS